MDVSRPPFPSPVLCIDGFLPEEDSQKVLQECIELKKLYVQAPVFDGPDATKVDREYRDNEALYLDDVFRAAPERSDILSIIKEKVWTEECKTLWHEGYSIFDVINYSTWHEAVISRYGNGAFYKKHHDIRRDHITYRLVTLVYYVNRLPEQFTGGSLILLEDDESLRLEPKHNRAVVFPSFTFHEVEPVSMSSEEWDSGRFSLNYWMGFR
jgi:Rps23 Pro-64 3,4-dihydroxylase Tpa1-like proline 4-hydroxylase